MKIALIGPIEGESGIPVHMRGLSSQLVRRGHEVKVIRISKLTPVLATIRYLTKLTAGFDIVHVHTPMNDIVPLLAGSIAGRGFVRGAVLTAHGLGRTYWGSSQRRYLVWRGAIRGFDTAISVSNFVRRYMTTLVGEDPPKHRTIYNGVDTGLFRETEDRFTAKKGFGLEKRFVLLYVGRLAKGKGLPELIKSLPSIKQYVRNVSLVICGEGEMEAELRRKAIELRVADCIEFRGSVTQERLPPYYNASDVVVVPSISEMMGIVLLEAMSMKKPVVASRVGGIPEVVTDMETGLLIPPSDVNALANAVLRLQEDPELALKMGENGRRVVENRFAWDRIAVEILDAYRDAEYD